MNLLSVNNIKKIYSSKKSTNKIEALKDISFTVNQGEFIAIMGESGSGKSTLLNIIASFDKPTSGSVILKQKDISQIKNNEMASFRRDHLGFVFQDFNLLDNFSLRDNIALPLVLASKKHQQIETAVNLVAEKLSITSLLDKYPYEVSGGQKQKAAVARALVNNPDIILADEPTGALDSKSTQELLSLFKKINSTGETILMVTHSIKAASCANRVLFIRDGQIYHQLYKGDNSDDSFYQIISESLTMMLTRDEEK